MMKTLNLFRILRALGTATGLFLGAANLIAQDGPPPGNFDPAQMRQRMMERLREGFDVKDDSEWSAISERITKVLDARRAARGSGGPGGFSGPGGPPPRDNRPPGNDAAPGDGLGQGPADSVPQSEFRGPPRGPGGPGGFNAAPSPEAQALRKAIEAKASNSELKAKLAEFKAARQKKQAELEKAQDELRQVLTVRQEAVAATFGIL
jgi:hypothetical protein